jgi:hypothetical protein
MTLERFVQKLPPFWASGESKYHMKSILVSKRLSPNKDNFVNTLFEMSKSVAHFTAVWISHLNVRDSGPST